MTGDVYKRQCEMCSDSEHVFTFWTRKFRQDVHNLNILCPWLFMICLLYTSNLMYDVFNNENESFMQETRLIESEYSVNLPPRDFLALHALCPQTGQGKQEDGK